MVDTQERMVLWELEIHTQDTKTCGWTLYLTIQINQETVTMEILKRVGWTVAARSKIIFVGFQAS